MDDSSERKLSEGSILKDVQSATIENISKNVIFWNGEDEQEPKVGMVFESYDDVFRFYKEYGHRKGFGVVIKRSWFRKGKCRRADLSCWKSGCGSINQQSSSIAKPTTKTNCQAMITVRNWKDDFLFITDVILDHNHSLSPSKARYFRCNRKLLAKKSDFVDETGMDVSGKPSLNQNGDKIVSLNSVHKEGTLKLKEGDAIKICEYFSDMQRKNPNFFYLLDWDEEGYLRNLFWADAKSRSSYDYFGDIVTFDTTFLLNKYDSPFVSFVGVNHHGNLVLFGCGLLADRSLENYVWLFKAWSSCTSGRSPKGIITDQCTTIQHAVSEVFPNSRHRFCLWNILKKIPEKLGYLGQYRIIKKEVKRIIYDSMKVSEFEDGWKTMIEYFGLETHSWLHDLYERRHFWVPVYLKNIFWAGMSTTQRRQSISSYFDDYVNSKTSLQEFINLYETALEDNYEKEAQANFESFHGSRYLLTQFPMEEKLSKLYTSNMFQKFQEELKAAIQCNVSILKIEGSVTYFEVRECGFRKNGEDGKGGGFKNFEVLYNACRNEVECICQGFNFVGIVCRHALSVLKFCQEYNLPSKYILDRWRKDFKCFHAFSHWSSDKGAAATNELERLIKMLFRVFYLGRKHLKICWTQLSDSSCNLMKQFMRDYIMI
ncbi:protein FAR1-RELATED SEQUENCE 6-like isoform X1 [Phalaenopsis equestris]|uniref:protein FAR1-RELATED SEQUENCE 6-like isoform X1 n=1 Tax=Phalaenopsis equestris TaxID=78828 RepID=UPI0009E4D309|nr:protein FAR1-RELATED SEQUENCE 6-like isoform X1 [Phalaenopsis equestris]XP_020586986.1 protein FAR1-RELATED SEQUENCE 6-like isoform X1 [Phalaenopsis equestris]XP_020586987.1 protein FAR1-RELATED SEQUENCE 6-like isoform X1 [Phalaenopsis equestris]